MEAYSSFIRKLVVAPSPEAASLGKYGNSDVNYYTGAMSLSIPIHNMSGRDIALPISLSYDGSGNRVEQIPSMTGLGFALSAGGVITRSVKGNPDKNANYYGKRTSISQTQSTDQMAEYDHLYDLVKGNIETQPDEYFFNFAGMSGKFYINPSKKVYMRKQQDLVISPSISADIDDFTIIDIRGNKYYFTAVESTLLLLDDNYGNIPSTSRSHTYNSSWFLTKIESANGTETINLTYSTPDLGPYSAPVNSYQYESLTCTSCTAGTSPPVSPSYSNGGINSITISNRRIINKIEYKLGLDIIQTVKFETTTSTHPFALGQQLNKIKIYNAGEGDMPTNQFAFLYDGTTNRLTLKSVQEQPMTATTDINQTKPPHTFVYNSTQLPTPTSNSIDHWGYYNGVSNTSLIPAYTGSLSCQGGGGSANRETDGNAVQAGVMTRINYPTGGYTMFEYEAHKGIDPVNAPNTEINVGGLRLKSVKSYENSGQLLTQKSYNYTKQGTTQTSGVVTQPNYTSTSSFTTYAGGCLGEGCYSGSTCATYSSVTLGTTNHTPLGADDGSHIFYSRVEEVLASVGKTVYNYNREDLIKKEVISESGNVLSETTYEYTNDNRSKSLFGYTAAAFESQDNKTQFIKCENNGGYIWRLPGTSNSATCTPAINGKRIFKTRFYRRGYLITSEFRQASIITEKQYFNNNLTDVVTTVTNLYYDNKNITQPTRTIVVNSNAIEHKTINYFAHDLQTDVAHPSVSTMITNNMIGIPLRTELYVNSQLKQAQEMVFAPFATNQLRPKYIRTRSRDGVWTTQFTVDSYNAVGLPLQTTGKGFNVSNTYGWSKNLLVSKQFGSTYPNILTSSFIYGSYNLLYQATDENGIRKKFTYDGLQRLSKVDDRFKPDGTDVQATANTVYSYKTSPTTNNYIQSNANFKNVAATQTSKQFMDGLGRTFMTERFNNDNTYTKTYITYDALGRTDKTYEPIVSNTEGVDVNYLTTVLVNKAYTQPTYEASPLSRPTAQRNLDGSFVYMAYNINTATEVLKFTVTSYDNINVDDNVVVNGFYGVNSLMKTTITNENGKFTHVFKDKLGRVVLTRKILNGGNVDTYNVYDDYGQLIMVIPPGAIEANTYAIKLSLAFCYKYDNQNRLCRKKVPSADWQKFFYDKRDFLTLVQDGNMRNPLFGGAANKYLGTQYNAIGQVLKTGWVTDTTGLWAGNIVITDANKLTEIQYYPNSTWVKNQAARVLKPTGVATEREFVWSYIERRPGFEYTGNPIWTGKQHIMSKTYRYGNTIIGDEPINDNDYGGVDWRVSAYDGAQKPTLTNHYLYSGPSSNNRAQEVREFLRFSYDNLQRLTTVKYDYARLGANPVEPTFILSNMNYNYKDQLVEKNTAFVNNKYLQSTDFTYNVRGWLTSINSGFLNSTLDYPLFSNTNNNTGYYSSLGTTGFLTPPAQVGEHNPDLFMEKIRYEDPNSGLPNSAPAQYNGNISQLEWQVAGRERQAYSLKYDDLDRLTEANYADIHTGFYYQNGWTSSYETDNKYKETVSYDLRGNIQSIARNGLTGNYMSNVVIGYYNLQDFMSYTYNPADLNKLDKIYDGANLMKGFKTLNNNSVFTYDANGNLKSDLNKNITLITYNHLNLPLVITFTNDASNQPRRIEFIYDATGAKLRKTTYLNNVVQEKRDYVNGVECKNDVLDRIPHTEGAVVRNENDVFEHQYVIKDHLGNARVTYRDGINKANNTGNTGLNDGTITVADMMQINHYYPFGMNMEGNWNGPSGKNKYQYNEKELNSDFGLDWNDYGARFYDAAIGRWNGVDNLAESYTRHSVYHYAGNNPIKNIDVDGNYYVDSYTRSAVSDVRKGLDSKEKYWEGKLKEAEGLNGKVADLMKAAANANLSEIGEAKCELNELDASTQGYQIAKSDNIPNGEIANTSFDKSTNNVLIRTSDRFDTKTIGHELKHAYQFEQGTINLAWTNYETDYMLYDKSDEFEGERRGSIWGRGKGVYDFKKLGSGYDKPGQPSGPLDIVNHPQFQFLKYNTTPTDIKEQTLNRYMKNVHIAVRVSVDGQTKKTYSGQ
jgi:RHS repeat-associated protein